MYYLCVYTHTYICICVMPGGAGYGNSRCTYAHKIFIAEVYTRPYHFHIHTCIICHFHIHTLFIADAYTRLYHFHIHTCIIFVYVLINICTSVIPEGAGGGDSRCIYTHILCIADVYTHTYYVLQMYIHTHYVFQMYIHTHIMYCRCIYTPTSFACTHVYYLYVCTHIYIYMYMCDARGNWWLQ